MKRLIWWKDKSQGKWYMKKYIYENGKMKRLIWWKDESQGKLYMKRYISMKMALDEKTHF